MTVVAIGITTGNSGFAECLRLCRVPNFGHSEKAPAQVKGGFTECPTLGRDKHSTKGLLYRVSGAWQRLALGKVY
jgi:hypothetical protein